VVAVLSDLTDLDAITLSTARLAAENRIDISTGWQLILLAGLANLVFKGAIVALLGSPQLMWRIAALFGSAVVGGLLIFWFWPNDLISLGCLNNVRTVSASLGRSNLKLGTFDLRLRSNLFRTPRWHNHMHGSGYNANLHRRLPDNLSIPLHRQ
jgi:hypothetical protein